MGHRFLVLFGAIALFASSMGVVMLRPRARGLTFMVHGAATLYVAQIFIGAAMIWINFDAWARALHLSMGSITWLLVSGAALFALYRAGGVRAGGRKRGPGGAGECGGVCRVYAGGFGWDRRWVAANERGGGSGAAGRGERGAAEVEAFRASYPERLRFEYRLDRDASEPPFRVEAMWHDGEFTYLRSRAQESPALYELRDG